MLPLRDWDTRKDAEESNQFTLFLLFHSVSGPQFLLSPHFLLPLPRNQLSCES